MNKGHSDLPHAFEKINELVEKISSHNTLICLDYDGTLTPIVEDFRKAFLPDEMRNILRDLADVLPVAVVSGRDIKYIQKNVALDNIYYAGSHGFEIEGPDNYHYEVEESQQILPVLDKAELQLKESFKSLKGVEVERKKYAIAVHFRHAGEEDINILQDTINKIINENPELKRGEGKKIVELKPNLDWHKGKAVQTLQKKILKDDKPVLLIYIGDDVTDEDAFRVLKNGYGILVGEHGYETYANFHLNDVDEVNSFLKRLANKS